MAFMTLLFQEVHGASRESTIGAPNDPLPLCGAQRGLHGVEGKRA